MPVGVSASWIALPHNWHNPQLGLPSVPKFHATFHYVEMKYTVATRGSQIVKS